MAEKPVPATPDVTAERVNIICELMREGLWKRGHTGEIYAKEWGLSLSTVEKLSAEAWRRVCNEANNPDAMRPEIAGILRTNLMRADKVMNFHAISKLADTYTKVIGARAPERHEHAVVVAQFETLTVPGKIAWIEERIEKLQTAKQSLIDAEDRKKLLGT